MKIVQIEKEQVMSHICNGTEVFRFCLTTHKFNSLLTKSVNSIKSLLLSSDRSVYFYIEGAPAAKDQE